MSESRSTEMQASATSVSTHANHVHQPGHILENIGNSPEETHRRLTLFMELDRNFQYPQALTVGADHQLAGKYVAIDDAGANGGQKPSAAKDLDSVRVGSPKPQHDLQHLVLRSVL